jgi:CMP-N-acetylneuraminic acid synthetase
MAIDVLAIIPARGGSKGIPGKNIKLMAGKPLIRYSIDMALNCSRIDKVVVSTDDEVIAQVSEEAGAEVIMRPPELATDQSLVMDAIRYTIDQVENQYGSVSYFVLLEATAPLRRMDDVEDSITALKQPGVDSVATFSAAKVSPNRMWRIEGDTLSTFIEGANPWLPRQKQPQAYELNGLVYGVSVDAMKRNLHTNSLMIGKIHPVISRHNVVDIDDLDDWFIAEKLIEREQK